MKKVALTLMSSAFIFALASQAGAVSADRLVVSSSDFVYDKDKCKEGEKWDEKMKKCVAK